jgi:hypothetical protein
MTPSKSKPEPVSSWDIKLQRRHEFCERFVREHHPGMADASRIKGARPLVSLDAARRFQDDDRFRWWLRRVLINRIERLLGGQTGKYLFASRLTGLDPLQTSAGADQLSQ